MFILSLDPWTTAIRPRPKNAQGKVNNQRSTTLAYCYQCHSHRLLSYRAFEIAPPAIVVNFNVLYLHCRVGFKYYHIPTINPETKLVFGLSATETLFAAWMSLTVQSKGTFLVEISFLEIKSFQCQTRQQWSWFKDVVAVWPGHNSSLFLDWNWHCLDLVLILKWQHWLHFRCTNSSGFCPYSEKDNIPSKLQLWKIR